MGVHVDEAKFEAMVRGLGYHADNHWVKMTRFTKGRIDFCFIKEVTSKMHLIFHPNNFGRVLSANPNSETIRISKHADTGYPRYSASDAPPTSCGVGVIFKNGELSQVGNFLRNMETAS